MSRRPQPVLSLVCPACGETFASAMQMDPETFDEIRLKTMLERCGVCHEASRFKKKDYFYRSPD